MPQDIYSLKHTILELNNLLCGAKVNKIKQPNGDEVVLTLYSKGVYNLILSTFAKYSRVGLTNIDKENPTIAPNFCMLLRKYLSGATITNFELLNEDRIIQITLKNNNDFKEENTYQLIVEIMNKYSNIFLVKNGVILGILKGQSQTLESKRILLIGTKYSPPEKQGKFNVYTANLDEIFKDIKREITGNYLLNLFDNFSPITAEELSFIINQNKENQSIKSIIEGFLNQKTQPTIIDGVLDVFPIDYSHLVGNRTYYDNFLDAQTKFYDKVETLSAFNSLKNSIEQKISALLKKENKKLNILFDREKESVESEKYRIFGELITNNIYNIKRGQKSANLFNYYTNENEIVPLQEDLSPQLNAKKYFKKYNKLKNALSITLTQKEETLNEIVYLNSLLASVEIAENIKDLSEILLELSPQQTIKKSQKDNKNKPAFLEYNINDFIVKVGKNNLQNEKLLDSINKEDIWLHAKNYHSSFVAVLSNGKEVPIEVILKSAEICAYYSQGKNCDKIEVVYTPKKNVKKPPKSKLGTVIYSSYNSISVSPNNHENLKI